MVSSERKGGREEREEEKKGGEEKKEGEGKDTNKIIIKQHFMENENFASYIKSQNMHLSASIKPSKITISPTCIKCICTHAYLLVISISIDGQNWFKLAHWYSE